jgi:hypothetical protein
MSATDSTLYTDVPPKVFEDLVLETLLFAREAAREDIRVAKAMFAMTSPVASLISSLTLLQLRTIAIANTPRVRVRWDSDPEFWATYSSPFGARRASYGRTSSRAKLLFCGEIIPPRR